MVSPHLSTPHLTPPLPVILSTSLHPCLIVPDLTWPLLL